MTRKRGPDHRLNLWGIACAKSGEKSVLVASPKHCAGRPNIRAHCMSFGSVIAMGPLSRIGAFGAFGVSCDGVQAAAQPQRRRGVRAQPDELSFSTIQRMTH